MTARLISPYHQPGFYDRALAKGQHRDIVGGRWDETGRVQMKILLDAGLRPEHQLLDVGAGSLRLGCKAVPYLNSGHYWGTDKSRALMLRGREVELADPARLSADHLVEDETFDFPEIPPTVTHVIAFAVFTHLPLSYLKHALTRMDVAFPLLQHLFVTLFLAPNATARATSLRQPDGVVTHPDRAPYHHLGTDALSLFHASGFMAQIRPDRLPRGQVLISATRT